MSAATEVLGRLYDAFAAGDGAALGALIGQTEWTEAAGGPYGGDYRGLGEVAEHVFGPLGRDVEGFTAVPDEILPVGDDRALALGYYRGAAAGATIEIRFAHLATVADGAIARFEQFTDTHLWQRALGRV